MEHLVVSTLFRYFAAHLYFIVFCWDQRREAGYHKSYKYDTSFYYTLRVERNVRSLSYNSSEQVNITNTVMEQRGMMIVNIHFYPPKKKSDAARLGGQ
jgi:hypothetical protein